MLRSRILLAASGFVMAILLTAALGFHPTAAHSLGGDQAAIDKLMQAQQAAWNRGDIAAFLVAYWDSPDVTFSGAGGTARGFQGIRERYLKQYGDRDAMGQLQFSDLEYRWLGP